MHLEGLTISTVDLTLEDTMFRGCKRLISSADVTANLLHPPYICVAVSMIQETQIDSIAAVIGI